jgi:ABC-type branched-subunit amino acid transport system ATPase component/ABC-type branched-subunit amino acid transport system permease subunit
MAVMTNTVLYAFLGLGAGVAYALIAQGLILIHRGTGVVNFAQGAIAMVAAYAYVWLTERSIPVVLAAILAIVFGGVVGALLQILVMRPLRRAPLLAKLVATLGVILVLEGLVNLAFSSTPLVKPLLPSARVTVLGATFGEERLYLLGIAIVLGVVLWAFTRFTHPGTLLRAAADSERGVVIIGYSLQVVGAATWAVGGVLAGMAGVFLAPITSVDSTTLVLVVIPALAVALLARFRSFGIATAAGLLVGILQSELLNWWHFQQPPVAGLQDALPFIVIILAMVIRGKLIPDRNAIQVGRPPLAPALHLTPLKVLAAAVVGVIALALLGPTYQTALTISFVSAIVALSLVVLTGYVGQISLVQMGFAGLGAFAAAKLATNLHVPFPLTVLASAVLVVPIGILIGLPALRVRGVNLAVVTLGAGVAISSLIFDDQSLSGGFNGSSVPSPRLFGVSVDGITSPFRYGLIALFVLLCCAVGVAWLRSSAIGLRMLAVRDNERAAAAEGLSLARTKLVAFAISSFLAGLAGALFAYLYGTISFDQFSPLASILFVSIAYIGGIASVGGAVTAGLLASGGLLFAFFSGFSQLDPYESILSGLAVVLTAAQNPDGLAMQLQKPAALLRRLSDRLPRVAWPRRPARGHEEVEVWQGRKSAEPDRAGEPLLRVEQLTVRFAGVTAVDGVDVTLMPGTFTGLIGPNGAGKTTFIDAVCGFVPASGTVRFAGEDFGSRPAHARARRGLRRTFQTVELFGDLTVSENLQVPIHTGGRNGRGVSDAAVRAALRLVGLEHAAQLRPGELSTGEQKLVGIARALMGRPRLLLLDEPAAGLDSRESQALGQRLRALLDMGIAILLVDHDLELVMGVCDRVIVLDRGRLIADGAPGEVRNDPAVRGAYIGDEIELDGLEIVAEGA